MMKYVIRKEINNKIFDKNVKSLAAVHTHTHTHTVYCLLVNKENLNKEHRNKDRTILDFNNIGLSFYVLKIGPPRIVVKNMKSTV